MTWEIGRFDVQDVLKNVQQRKDALQHTQGGTPGIN